MTSAEQEWIFDCGFSLSGDTYSKLDGDRKYSLRKETKGDKFILSCRESDGFDIWTPRDILGVRDLFEELEIA